MEKRVKSLIVPISDSTLGITGLENVLKMPSYRFWTKRNIHLHKSIAQINIHFADFPSALRLMQPRMWPH